MPDLTFAGSDFILDREDLADNPALLSDLLDCGGPGAADEAVAYVLRVYDVQGDVADCAAYLRGYGAWEDHELEDHEENLARLVWLTGCALNEGESAYFSRYA